MGILLLLLFQLLFLLLHGSSLVVYKASYRQSAAAVEEGYLKLYLIDTVTAATRGGLGCCGRFLSEEKEELA